MTTLSPVAGVTRLRALQLGLETTPLTQHAATRRYPWSATPTINPNITKSTADTGTLDNAIAPYPKALDIGVQMVGELFANDAPTLISAGVMGGLSLTGGGAAKTMTAAPASLTQDVFDTYTGEAFDDATGDAWQFTGGVINDFSLEYPQDMGPIKLTANWRFAAAAYPGTPTGSLTVDTAPVPLYCADTYFFVNDTSGAIGTTQLVSQIYGAKLTVQNNLDLKRFANGNSTRFNIANYGRANRMVDFEWTFAKATAAIAEAVLFIAASPTTRYAEIRTTSLVAAQAGIPHQLRWRIPGAWFTRTEQVINTNTGFSLMGHQVYDTGLGYPFQVVSTSTRTTL
jgi:hypothetical protein